MRSTEPISPWSPVGNGTNREPGARRPEASQREPGLFHSGERHALVLLSHDHDDRLRRRVLQDRRAWPSARRTADEWGSSSSPPVMEEANRIARRQLLDPPRAEAQGWRHQDQRSRRRSRLRRLQGDQRPERAPDDDRRLFGVRRRDRRRDDLLEVQLPERGLVQIGRDDPVAQAPEDAPAAARSSAPVATTRNRAGTGPCARPEDTRMCCEVRSTGETAGCSSTSAAADRAAAAGGGSAVSKPRRAAARGSWLCFRSRSFDALAQGSQCL